VADIEGEGLNKMLSLGAETDEIRIAIGPAIEKCCFEVGPEVVEALRDLLTEDAEPFVVPRGDKYMVDLKGAVRQRFIQLGAKPGNIDIVDGCTLCEPERFWSHRYTGGVRGSQASVIMLS
jgi:copper oxidase (laccase) domain-containing protein